MSTTGEYTESDSHPHQADAPVQNADEYIGEADEYIWIRLIQERVLCQPTLFSTPIYW